MSYTPKPNELKILKFIASSSHGKTRSQLWTKYARADVATAIQSLRAARLIRGASGVTHADHFEATDAGHKLAES